MVERMGGAPRTRRHGERLPVRAGEQLPVNRNLERNIPREDIFPPQPIQPHVPATEPARAAASRHEIVAQAPVLESKQEGLSTGAKVAIGAGAVVAAAPLAAAVGATYAGHKAADYISHPIAKFVLNLVNKFGKFNPFSKVWNFLIGKSHGGSHGGHSGGHGHSHGDSHGHGAKDHHSH